MVLKNCNKHFALYLLLILMPSICPGKSIFWEAKSGTATVYLLGSIHMGKDTMYPLKPIIEKSFKKSNALVVEVNISDVDQNDVIGELMYKDGKTLKSELSDSLYKKFEGAFKSLGISIALFNNYKPTMLIQTLSLLALTKSGYKPDIGVDMHFLKKAKDKKKEIIELETVEQQMDLLMGGTDTDSSEQFLYKSLDEFQSSVLTVDSILCAWLQGDSDRIAGLCNRGMGESPEYDAYMKKILDDRNVTMTEKVEGFLANEKVYFVIVGAAHLVGDNGIVSRLQKTGKYKIKQL